MSLDKKILEKIERENLKIRPSWFFTLKNLILGTGTFSAIILGSLSLALLLQIMRHKWENLTWLSVPYFNLILFGIFLIAGYWLVIRIDSLFKLKFLPIMTTMFFISLSFGYMTFASGEARKIERELEEVPIYTMIIPIDRDIPSKSKMGYEYNHRSEYAKGERKEWHGDGFEKDENKQAHHSHHSHNENNNKRENHGDELENKNKDAEVRTQEKRQNIVNEKNSEKGEVKGVNKEITINKTKIESEEAKDDENKKSDSDNKDISSDGDNEEDPESDSGDED